MIGRVEELQFVSDAIREGGAGVLVAGRAGVGKTRLVREVLDAAQGVHVELVTATESVRPLPFGAFTHLLPDHAGDIDRVDLLSVFGHHLQLLAAQLPLVLAVDDAHLLDGLSAAFVDYLVARHLATVVLTVRSGEPMPDALRRMCQQEGIPRLELQALSRSEFDLLVERALGGGLIDGASLERIWNITQGNALFARELCTDLLQEGELREIHQVWQWSGGLGAASRLRELIAARIEGVDAAGRRFLNLLSIGEPLPIALADKISTDAVLIELEQRGLIVVIDSDEPHVYFSHPMFREVLRAAMPSFLHRRFCRELALHLREASSKPTEVLKLAVLWEGSGETADAELLGDAAHAALQFSDFKLCEHFARAALDQGPTFRAELDLGECLVGQHRFESATEILVSLVGREPDDGSRERLADGLALALGHGLGQVDQALDLMHTIELSTSDSRTRALIQCHRATLLSFVCRYDEAISLGMQALSNNEDDGILVRFLTSVASSLVMVGRVTRALELTEKGLRSALRVREEMPRALSWAVTTRCTALAFAGRASEAIALSEMALATPGLAAETRARANVYRARFLLFHGKPATALRSLKDASSALRSLPTEASWCLALIAEAEALMDHHEAASAAKQEALALRVTNSFTFYVDELRGLAWVDAKSGHIARAIGELRVAADMAEERSQYCFELLILQDLMRLGEAEIIDRASELATNVDGLLAAAVGLHARAMRSQDGRQYEAAAKAFAEIGSSIIEAELWQAAAFQYRREGLVARSAKSARRADDAFKLSEGGSTLMVGPIEIQPLTRRQREVAILAARGAENSEIATSLSVSERTVESHLYAAFVKLGISSRQELGAALSRTAMAGRRTSKGGPVGRDISPGVRDAAAQS